MENLKSRKHESAWRRVLWVAFILGIFETILEFFIGHPLTETQQSRLLAFGLGGIVIWLIDDVLRVLGRILDELKGRDDRRP